MTDMSIHTPETASGGDQPTRYAAWAASAGALALVGAGLALWSTAGVGVFVDVILAGLSACF